MRRAVIGSEVGANFSPGFGAIHQMRRTPPRFRINETCKLAGWGVFALIAFAAIGHMH